ncbi:hypothetical protein TI04_07175 [Achromatium sp. WMS2]|nr:hypothetical protein TI04_07175 [Achromatium sp. WMS2]
MRQLKILIATLLMASTGLVPAAPITSATAPKANPPSQNPAPKKTVHPRALITQVEIAEYRRAMSAAPTPEAKHAIRNETYNRLRLRAAEKGMVMSEPQPWYGGLHWGEIMHPEKTPTPHPEKPVAPRIPSLPRVP